MIGGLDAPTILAMLALGTVTGFLAGLLGVGGGMLMVPFMSAVMLSRGFPSALAVKMAIATSLATICFTSVASVRTHHRRGAVLWPVVVLLTPGIVIGSLAGAQVAKALPGELLAFVFAGFVGFSAIRILVDPRSGPSRQLPGRAGMLAAGGAIGMIAALLGAGGAFVSVPFMTRCNVKIHNAVATSAALGFPVAVAGSLGYVIAGRDLSGMPPGTLGYLYLPALFTVAIASVSAAPFGARLAHSLDVRRLRQLFAVLLLGLAAYMVFKAFSTI